MGLDFQKHLTEDHVEQSKSTPIHTASPQETKIAMMRAKLRIKWRRKLGAALRCPVALSSLKCFIFFNAGCMFIFAHILLQGVGKMMTTMIWVVLVTG